MTSVWTKEDEPQHVSTGDVWRVKIGSHPAVRTVKVLEISHAVCQLMEMPYSHLQPRHEMRTVKFLEQVLDGS